LDGFHGDCSEMFVAGELDDAGKHLLQATYDSWIAACQFVESGKDYKDIGAIIEDHVTPRGYSSVRNFCGHGIGRVGGASVPESTAIHENVMAILTLLLAPFVTFSYSRRRFTPILIFYTIATRNPTGKWPSVTPLRLSL
jgi:methionine aminopeptidase